ncbi:MAG TPA: PAS domain S-box protein, partial [Desulfuromonadaceae bacterium]
MKPARANPTMEKVPTEPDRGAADRENELRILRQIAFASGVFQEDVTIRTLLESLAEGVVIIDDSGTILLVNGAAEKMFGYQRTDLIGKPHAMLIPERFRALHEEHEAGYFKEPRIRPMGQLLDLTGRRRDGSEFPLEISLGFIETTHGILVLALVSDMTLRKQFEMRLQESERLFSCFMLHLPAVAWMKDLDGRYVYANVEAERVLSVPLPELLGKTDDELLPPETARQFKENDRRLFFEGGSLLTTEVLRRPGGMEHHSLVSKFVVPGPDDQAAYVAGVAFDITERVRAEEALRFSEARFRSLHDENPAMIFTIDAEGAIVTINPAGTNQLGYTANELEGQSVLKIFHEDDRPVVAGQLRSCLQNPDQVHRWQLRKIRKDGGLLWVEEVARAIYDLHGNLNVLVVCQDVTERKRAEESEQRFRALVTASSEVLYRMSPDWSEMRELYSREFLANTERPSSDWLQKYIHPDDQPHVTAVIQEAIRTKSMFELEHRVRQADGSLGWTFSRAVPLMDADGEIVEWFGAASDITERKRTEEALQKSEAKFSMIFNLAPVGITISTLADGRFVDINAAGERFSGY